MGIRSCEIGFIKKKRDFLAPIISFIKLKVLLDKNILHLEKSVDLNLPSEFIVMTEGFYN